MSHIYRSIDGHTKLHVNYFRPVFECCNFFLIFLEVRNPTTTRFYYTLLLKTRYHYTLLLHTTTTGYYYTILLHSSTTRYYYTLVLHATITPFYYILLIHCTSRRYSYTLLHITNTLYF